MAEPLDNSDIPTNKAVLMGIGVIAGAFSFFQLASCTSSFISTPEFVQAIEACNASAVVPVTIKPDGEMGSTWHISIVSTPEIRSSLEKCHQAALEKFQPQPKPILDRIQKP